MTPPKKTQCRIVRQDGTQCPNPAKMGRLCGVHLPKKSKPSLKVITKAVGFAAEILTLAIGAEQLIELTVQFWRNLPFGSMPGMPAEYEFLARKLPPSYPKPVSDYHPVSKGPDSIDWVLAKDIYLRSLSLQREVEAGASGATLLAAVERLNADATRLIDTVQPELQARLVARIAADSEAQPSD
jgi:hypothetical protein